MKLFFAIVCLFLAGPLMASGGSPQSWLDGTQSWDTTPQKELDLGLRWAGADGLPAWGLEAQAGPLDTLQVAGLWEQREAGARGELKLQWREANMPTWRPALGLLARAPYDGSQWRPSGGLVLAYEAWDWSLVGNVEYVDGGHSDWRTGLWSPYWLYIVRLGAESRVQDGRLTAWTPQVACNLPGDITFNVGARLDPTGAFPARWMARLSYEIFPNP